MQQYLDDENIEFIAKGFYALYCMKKAMQNRMETAELLYRNNCKGTD